MNGFKMGVVFQHKNNKFGSFTALRGGQDAERSLMLAAENSQPRGSAIYFGVDGPWNTPYELANVTAYFQEVSARLAGSGYRVGGYWSGVGLEVLGKKGLAQGVWVGTPADLSGIRRLL